MPNNQILPVFVKITKIIRIDKLKQNRIFFPRIRRVFIYLMERYCPFNIKTFQILVGIVTTVLLSAVLILGLMSSKKVKEVVTQDFNKQQLVLAQHAARQIENKRDILKKNYLFSVFRRLCNISRRSG
jgi:hypothetical protein